MAAPALRPLADAPPPAPVNQNRPALGGPWNSAIDTLARTLWGEARDQPVRSIEAVASVVLNRVAISTARQGCWWGDGIVSVCRHPGQFPCWDQDRAGRAVLLALKPGDPVFDTCLRIARRATAGVLPDPTNGATHYHAATKYPPWAANQLPTAEIGTTLFYRIEP